MKEAFERVKTERLELKSKIEKLFSFLNSENFKRDVSPVQQSLLFSQYHVMSAYLNILEFRIRQFEKELADMMNNKKSEK